MIRSVAVNGSCGAGLSLIVYASWLAWHPLAFALAGGLLCAFGVFFHRSTK